MTDQPAPWTDEEKVRAVETTIARIAAHDSAEVARLRGLLREALDGNDNDRMRIRAEAGL